MDLEEYWKSYSSITDFKQDLGEEALAHEKFESGWVLYEELLELEQPKIRALLKRFASPPKFFFYCLIQFWGVVKVEGSHHYLSSSHHPFYVSNLNKGLCWYRKLCRDHKYIIGGDEEQQLGGVGRVYQNKQPESTPDLRLYSTHEFPMRDEAARFGFKDYMALPLFDPHTDQCYGVLELIQCHYLNNRWDGLLCRLDGALQIVGLRSTHNSSANSSPIKEMVKLSAHAQNELFQLMHFPIWSHQYKQLQQPESEISEVLELAVATIPQLYLAQVWIPCNSQCLNFSTNLCCMEMISFIHSQTKIFNSWHGIDDDMYAYLKACEFHKLQIDVHSCHSTLYGLTISENLLAHYAQRARISHCIEVSHKSNSNHVYLFQFFLQPKDIQDDHSLHLLLRILEINLTGVSKMFVSGKQLVEKYVRADAIECESIDSFSSMKSYMQNFLELDMTTYLNMVNSCCLKHQSASTDKGWVFLLPAKQSVCEEHVKSNSSMIKEKMEGFMKKIAVESWKHNKWIVQFWVPKMTKNRCYLKTSDQPYVVGCLAKGMASYRKQCTTHYYFVDGQAKQDELGPPGRVFKFEHPEISPDLFYYTRDEFPIRNFAMLCCNRGYLALPVFDDEGIDNHKVVGVLEFIGFYYSDLQIIEKLMKEEYLCSTHIDFHSRFLGNEPVNIVSCKEKALAEIRNAYFRIKGELSLLHVINVWVPIAKCVSATNSNMICMELAFSINDLLEFMPTTVQCIHVQAKKGIIGMVLASENKSCFCPNLSEFSIVDQPMLHYDMSDRRDACFAICLQSLHTGNLVYVMEFFLYQGPATYKYVGSFLSLLLPLLKHKLSSFKMACGKELGEELVVEVIEFSDANKLDSSELEAARVYPVIFKTVQYNQKEYHHTEEHQQNEYHHIEEEEQQQQNVYHHAQEEQHAEECTIAASDSNTREKEKRKNSLNLSVLESHFGEKLNDVAKELGVGRSTVKRACRDHGIRRWPNRKQHKKNPSLFEEKSAADLEQGMLPSTSNVHPLENVTQINTGSADKVIVKVEYNKDLIKFELSLSLLGLAKLNEEVATSLNLEKGSFKLKYKDEDGDEILLTRDVDLQHCPKTRTTRGETLIQLFVR